MSQRTYENVSKYMVIQTDEILKTTKNSFNWSFVVFKLVKPSEPTQFSSFKPNYEHSSGCVPSSTINTYGKSVMGCLFMSYDR